MSSPRRSQRDLAQRLRRDPVGFARVALEVDPWSKQREIMEAVRDHPRVAVRSCHGSGKTLTAAALTLWFLTVYPNSIVITVAPTQRQVEQILWREIRRLYRSVALLGGKISTSRLDLGPRWFAVGFATNEPDRLQGFHAENILVIVDEASGVGEEIFEAVEGLLTTADAKLLMIGNPLRLGGSFHRAFTAEREACKKIAISAFDTPAFTGEAVADPVLRGLISLEWVEGRRDVWGEESPLWESRVLGEFPTSSIDSVIPLAVIEEACRRTVDQGHPVVLGVDVARFGDAETVVALRRGRHVRILETWANRETTYTAGRILRLAREVRSEGTATVQIVVDDVGVGGGVVDMLREPGEFVVHAYNGGHQARRPLEYPNRRSEDWFGFGEQLEEIDLDQDAHLVGELASPVYTIDSKGRRVVESKDQTVRRLRRSPDRADAVVIASSIPETTAAAEFGWIPGEFESVPRGNLPLDPRHV